jgi:hypothetical protein
MKLYKLLFVFSFLSISALVFGQSMADCDRYLNGDFAESDGSEFGGTDQMRDRCRAMMPDEGVAPQQPDDVIIVTADRDRESPVCTDRSTVRLVEEYRYHKDRNAEEANPMRFVLCQANKEAATSDLRYFTTCRSSCGGNAACLSACPALNQGDFDLTRRVAEEINCQTACPAVADAAAPPPPASSGPATVKYTNGARVTQDGNYPAPACLSSLHQVECNAAAMCASGTDQQGGQVSNPDCVDVPVSGGSPIKVFAPIDQTVNFEDLASCHRYFSGQPVPAETAEGSRNFNFSLTGSSVNTKICRLIASDSSCSLPANRGSQPAYDACVSRAAQTQKRVVVGGAKKCAAILAAGNGTSEFTTSPRVQSSDGKVICKRDTTGFAYDYKSCDNFRKWYDGLIATQAGVQVYNQIDVANTGRNAQNRATQEIAAGNGQVATVDASRQTTLAGASAEERNKMFFIGKGAAITTQLLSFVTESNIDGECNENTQCCTLFDTPSSDGIQSASTYFPNRQVKDQMIAEVVKAGGEAALAAMREKQLRDQAAALKAIEQQITATDTTNPDEGVLKFCQQNPTAPQCLGPGQRVSARGSSFNSGFGGQNFGLGNIDGAAAEDIAIDPVTGGAAAAAGNSVGDIGSMDGDAAAAKNEWDKAGAARGGGGTPSASGGTGASASAAANGLSNDPGVEGEQKAAPQKITSKSATYEGGAGYNGGGYRAGNGANKEEAGNPFASMFGKDKGRSPSAVTEIDKPTSDLFTKISDRYREVQKRKALMDVP